jgi:sugar-specific transcriptional regulator TrmB
MKPCSEGETRGSNMNTAIQPYLDKAIDVLNEFGIAPREDETVQMSRMLEDIVSVDREKVVAVGRVMQYQGSFNELVRDKIENVQIGDRYGDITSKFDSIREDGKRLVTQLDDGKIDTVEKLQNAWMRVTRGTIGKRFEGIRETYLDVSSDAKDEIDRERTILDAYADFRGALKEATAITYELEQQQDVVLRAAIANTGAAQETVVAYAGEDKAYKTRLEGARDQALRMQREEQRKYDFIKDFATQLEIGYNAGETVMAKLAQTSEVKEQVWRRSVTFFKTNEHVFTALGATYIALLGLHEKTETLNAMTGGINNALEDLATLGDDITKKGLEAAHGVTISADSVKKLVDSIVEYQTTTQDYVRELRAKSDENARAISTIVEDGKQRVIAAVTKYSL